MLSTVEFNRGRRLLGVVAGVALALALVPLGAGFAAGTNQPEKKPARGPLKFQAHSLSFGRIQVGTSVAKAVTLTNNTKVAIDITHIATTGTGYSSSQNCLGMLAASGGTCAVSVTFSPIKAKKVKGTQLTGTLTLKDNATNSPQKVSLTGVAFGTPTATPTATPSPTPAPTQSPPPVATATGAPTGTPTPTSTPSPTPSPTATPCASGICGQVVGGLAPIASSSVTLLAVGNGYGSGATALGTVASGADGSFNLSSYTCPAGNPETYIMASGGNAGGGANPAIALMAALGPCNSLSTSTTIAINELTTAAAQWALAQFLDSSGHTIGAPSTNATGLRNAFIGFANLADINSNTLAVSGNPSSLLPSLQTCQQGFPPPNCDALERLNTLADILAGCVNSAPSSSACAQLFCAATPGFTYSTACSGTPAIADTLGAARTIVANPASNVKALYGLAPATPPFSPMLAIAPDGWELALNFAPAGAAFDEPLAVTLDGSGNVFVSNIGNSVSELTAQSGYATGLNFAPPGAVLNDPVSIALDGSGNVFVANCGIDCSHSGPKGTVSELTAASVYSTGLSFAPTGAVLHDPLSIALDGSGNVFVANCGNDCSGASTGTGTVSELTAASSYGAGFSFAPPSAAFNDPLSIALDGSGDVFVANCGSDCSGAGNTGSVSELTAGSSYGTGFSFAPAAAMLRGSGSIALDASANVFVEDSSYTISELTAASGYGTGFNFDPEGAELDDPYSIAVDAAGNVFVANFYNRVSELTAASGYDTGFSFAPAGAALDEVVSIAMDESGNVFVANQGGSVSEFLALARPVITPVQSCVIFWGSHPGQGCLP